MYIVYKEPVDRLMSANLFSRIYIIRKHQLPFFICVTRFFFLNVTIVLDFFYSIKQCMTNVTLLQRNISRESCKSDKQTSAQHEFVYRICKSRGKFFLYLKVNVV